MKKVIFIVLPILLLGGGFVGLAITGIIKVPGLTPKKAKAGSLYGENAAKVYTEPKTEVVVTKPDETKPKVAPVVEVVKTDPEKGAKKIAQLWNNIPTVKLAELSKLYKDNELADVLVQMDPEKVAELLALLDAKRSAKLSKELQRVASVVPKVTG